MGCNGSLGCKNLELRMTAWGRVSRGLPVQTAMGNCTRDKGRSFEAGSQVLASNRCKLLSSKARLQFGMVAGFKSESRPASNSGPQRGSPKVAGTRRAAPGPFRRALSYQALEAVLRRGTVPAEAAGSDQSERPLGRDRAHAAGTHRNLRPRHRQASELRGGVITSLRVHYYRSFTEVPPRQRCSSRVDLQ
jgi:hypothetical protein